MISSEESSYQVSYLFNWLPVLFIQNNCCIKVFQSKERGEKKILCRLFFSCLLLVCNQWELPDYVWHHLQGLASPAACDTHQDRLEQDPELQNWQGDAECLVDHWWEGAWWGLPKETCASLGPQPTCEREGLTKAKRYQYGGKELLFNKSITEGLQTIR